MIALLAGTVRTHLKNPVVVMVGGVGYAVHVPEGVRSRLPPDSVCTLHIHTHMTDNALELYGFLTEEELGLFELLLTVSGIGPKTALAISDRGANSVEQAIIDSDVDFFTMIPRLGKKNAQKIIIELKTKLGGINDLDLRGDTDGMTKQVLDALMAMGFNRNEAVDAIKKLGKDALTIEDKIRHALKFLAKPK